MPQCRQSSHGIVLFLLFCSSFQPAFWEIFVLYNGCFTALRPKARHRSFRLVWRGFSPVISMAASYDTYISLRITLGLSSGLILAFGIVQLWYMSGRQYYSAVLSHAPDVKYEFFLNSLYFIPAPAYLNFHHWCQTQFHVFDRPGVAGAVLQTAS